MAHIFISYSRKDQPYARQLAEDIRRHGFDVWIDDRIDYGDRWWRTIVKAIEVCGAFIIVMSPAAEESEWVEREILLAQRGAKPIFPLLLEGKEHALLITTQFANVRDQSLPPDDFYDRLRDVITPADQTGKYVAPIPSKTPESEITVARQSRLPLPAKYIVPILAIILVGSFGLWQAFSSITTPTPPPTTAIAQLATETPDATRTLEAMVTNIIATNAAEETAIAAAFTPTPTPTATSTPSNTPNTTLTAEAQNTQAAIIAAEQIATQRAQLTANAPTNTPEPTTAPTETSTWTPPPTATETTTSTITPDTGATAAAATRVHDEALATIQAQETFAAQAIAIANETAAAATPLALSPTPVPSEIPRNTPITANNQWTPVERDFDGVTMVLVPVGCFDMGENGEGERQCFDQPFWIDRTEVTNEQFNRLGGVAADTSNWTEPQNPRETISWSEARDFCESRGGRLPTEREWEYAARGPDGLIYPWGNEFIADNVVYYGNFGSANSVTANVASRPGGKSWVGAYDMSGNVWEWTASLSRRYPYNPDDGREDNSSIETDTQFILRGGPWQITFTQGMRAAYRLREAANIRYYFYGFRCVRAYGSEATSLTNATTTPTDTVTDLAVTEVNGITLTVNAEAANLREGPGTNYNRAGTVVKGTVLPIVARTADSEWYLVEYESGSRAWIWSEIVSLNGNDNTIVIAATIPPVPTSGANTSNNNTSQACNTNLSAQSFVQGSAGEKGISVSWQHPGSGDTNISFNVVDGPFLTLWYVSSSPFVIDYWTIDNLLAERGASSNEFSLTLTNRDDAVGRWCHDTTFVTR